MRAFALAVGLILGIGLCGCAQRKKEVVIPPPPPITTETLSSIRADMQKVDATSRLGAVTSVRAQDNLAAIEDMNIDGLHENDTVSIVGIIDGKQVTIASASVVRLDGKILVVRYTTLPGAARGPVKDDLAVIFGKK